MQLYMLGAYIQYRHTPYAVRRTSYSCLWHILHTTLYVVCSMCMHLVSTHALCRSHTRVCGRPETDERPHGADEVEADEHAGDRVCELRERSRGPLSGLQRRHQGHQLHRAEGDRSPGCARPRQVGCTLSFTSCPLFCNFTCRHPRVEG